VKPFAVLLLAALAWGDSAGRRTIEVPCEASGPICGEALQEAINIAPPGSTLVLDPEKVYEGTLVIKPKPGADRETRLTITTRNWDNGRAGWDGVVTPADKPRLAVLRARPRSHAAIDIRNGPNAGFVTLTGLAVEANRPSGQGELIRIGSDREASAANMARDIAIRQVLLQGSREFGQKRGIAANGQDIEIAQIWCEEMFIAGQDTQCVSAWNGGKRVRVHHSYLAAGSENILLGGAPIASAEMHPEDWTIEDNILHKPQRWKEDGRNRQVKNLFELKFGTGIVVRRNLMVGNWSAAQDGKAILMHYTTNGACPPCGGLHDIVFEDNVVLNSPGGISFQGYTYRERHQNSEKLLGVSVRNNYFVLTGGGSNRVIAIGNVLGRHDLRFERNTFVNESETWLVGNFGWGWSEGAMVRGGPMEGLWIVDNVVSHNGRYGITAPSGSHYGSGIGPDGEDPKRGPFVSADLQIAGNVLGDAPPAHLGNYNRHAPEDALNVSASTEEMREKLTASACGEWVEGKGADCARLAPVFALLKRLPEP
jgi:hypothetical protein